MNIEHPSNFPLDLMSSRHCHFFSVLRIHFNYKHAYLSRAIVLHDCKLQSLYSNKEKLRWYWHSTLNGKKKKNWKWKRKKFPNRCAFCWIYEWQRQSKSTYSVDSHQWHCHSSKVTNSWMVKNGNKKTNKTIVKGGIGKRKIANSIRCKT